MIVTLAQSSGFCFGVKSAVQAAEKAVLEHTGSKLVMLGEIVHNKYVVDKNVFAPRMSATTRRNGNSQGELFRTSRSRKKRSRIFCLNFDCFTVLIPSQTFVTGLTSIEIMRIILQNILMIG